MARRRVAVLISGRGTNMSALIAASRAPDYPAEIVQVISDRPAAEGLAIAAADGVPTVCVDRGAFPDRARFEAAIDARLAECGAELVCLAGFMRILSPDVVERWRDRMLNIHPSLLPSFPGLHPHAQAIAAGVKLHGCTVHFVRPKADSGPIIAQAAVPVLGSDTPDTLADRVLEAEHILYPQALRLVAAGRTRVLLDRVLIDGETPAVSGRRLFAPAVE